MKASWEERSLGDLCDLFDHLRVPLNSRERSMRNGPYPYYGAQGIVDWIDDYRFDGRYILTPEDGANLTTRKLPIAYFASGKFWVNNHAHVLRGKPDRADDVFLMHAINNLNIAGYVTGAAQPKLSQANLKRLVLKIPPLPTQRRIAAILSAYDDFIEVNTRRIAILEEMARRVYEEWFVLGAKRSQVRLSEAASITMGQSPQSKFYNEDKQGVAFHQGVADFGVFHPSNRLFCSVAGREARAGDILMSVRAPVGRINVAAERIIIGRGLAAIRSISGHQAFLLSALKTVFKTEDSMGSGTIFNSVSKSDVQGIEVPLATDDEAERYEAVCLPMWGLLSTLVKQNANLRAQRDLLLPRLVSGKLDVSEAGAALEESAA